MSWHTRLMPQCVPHKLHLDNSQINAKGKDVLDRCVEETLACCSRSKLSRRRMQFGNLQYLSENVRRGESSSLVDLFFLLAAYHAPLVFLVVSTYTAQLLHFRFARGKKLPSSFPSCSPLYCGILYRSNSHYVLPSAVVLPRVLLICKRGLPCLERYEESGNQIRANAEARANL